MLEPDFTQKKNKTKKTLHGPLSWLQAMACYRRAKAGL